MLLNQFKNTYNEANGWFGPEEMPNGKLRMAKHVNYKFNYKGKERIRHCEFKYLALYHCAICGQQAIAQVGSLKQKRARKDEGNVCEMQTKGNSCMWKSVKDRNPFCIGHKNVIRLSSKERGSFENPIIRYGYPGYFEYTYTKDGMYDHKKQTGGSDSFVRMHRIIAEKYILKRKLKPGEQVHHINMDKLDYSVNNLWVCSQTTHQTAHMSFNNMCEQLMINLDKYCAIAFNKQTGAYYLTEKELTC